MSQVSLLPDFLIIGAGKSGTTSLDKYLKQHPDIFMSAVKEPNFFGFEMVTPEDLKNDKEELKYYNQSVTTLEEYKALFKKAKPGQKKGEVSNTYLYHQTAPDRIKHYIPDAKLIAILRNPVERLYSRFLHLGRENKLPTQSFNDVLDENSIWWRRNDLVKEGMYYKNLSRYYELFPSKNIKVFLFEDLKNPQPMLKEIFTFLGVDDSFTPDFSIIFNKSGFIKNKFYDKLIGHNSIIKENIKKTMPEAYQTMKSRLWLQRIVNSVRDRNLIRPKLDANLKHEIQKKVYANDILQLQDLIQKDLCHWIND